MIENTNNSTNQEDVIVDDNAEMKDNEENKNDDNETEDKKDNDDKDNEDNDEEDNDDEDNKDNDEEDNKDNDDEDNEDNDDKNNEDNQDEYEMQDGEKGDTADQVVTSAYSEEEGASDESESVLKQLYSIKCATHKPEERNLSEKHPERTRGYGIQAF